MIQNGRLVRNELKRGNIKEGMKDHAFKLIEMGMLADRYCTLFGDSIATTSFYVKEKDKDGVVKLKPAPIDAYLEEFKSNYKNRNINLATHPIMRTYQDEDANGDRDEQLARIAAVSCMHQCIPESCGGDRKTGEGCRFDYPKQKIGATVVGIFKVGENQMEARLLLKRTCERIPHLNRHFMRYWRGNQDVTVLIDASHKMRYV